MRLFGMRTVAIIVTSALGITATVLGVYAAAVPAHSAVEPKWPAADRTGNVRLSGQVPLAVAKLRAGRRSDASLLGAHPAESAISLNFTLPLHDTGKLDALISEEARTHVYPSRAQLYRQFAPPAAQLDALRYWLTAHGYTITHVSRDGTSVTASAPTATVEQSLGTKIDDYRRDGYRYRGIKIPAYEFYANAEAPQVPARLGVRSISGLSDIDRFFTDAQLAAGRLDPDGTGSGPSGVLTRSGGYYPEDLRSMYDISGHGVDASGQTIGFTLWGAGETQTAMTKYATTTGDTPITVDAPCTATGNSPTTPSQCVNDQPAPNHLESILENGNTNGSQGTWEFDGDIETALDVEQAHGMAPDVAMKYYLADCTETPPSGSGLTNADCNGTDVGLEEAVEDAAADPTLHSVSDSWGYGGEAEWGDTDPFKLATEQSFALAAAAGTTFWFSTGDQGTYESGYPADSPYVAAVGGTSDFSTATPTGDGSEQRSTATAWTAAGSWCSNLEPRPAWQDIPQVDALVSCPGRSVPDVSADADTNTAVYFVSSTDGSGGMRSGEVGGTSVAAPLLNGMEADTEAFLDQQSYPGGSTPAIGFEAPMLYRLGAGAHGSAYFNDVVCGNTASPASGPDGDAAGAGWDPATGWGELDWFNYSTGYAIALGATGLSQPASLSPGYAYGCARTPTNATERGISLPTRSVGYAVGSASSSTPWPAKFFASNAWGATNDILETSDGGATWQTTNSDMLAIACTGASTCIEVGDGGRIRRTTDAGATWTYVVSPFDKALTSVQCPTASVCYAAGDRGTILKSTDGGTTWTFLPSADGNPLYSLACPTASTCYAVDEYAHVAKTSDGGGSWTLEQTPITTPGVGVPGSGGPNPYGGLFGIACSDANDCVAVGGYPPSTTDPPIVTTDDGGRIWTLVTSNAGSGHYLGGVSCAGGTCYAVGRAGTIVTSDDGGDNWTAMTSNVTAELTGIYCSSASACIATGQSGSVDVLSDGTWTPTTGTPAGSNFLAAVTCTSATACVAVGKQGVTMAFDPADVSGSAALQAGGGTTQQLTSISCADAGDCVAVGNLGTILRTGDGGQTWLSPASGGTTNLNGVACVSADCYAVGVGGAIIASTDGGSTWSTQPSGVSAALTAVTCVSAGACVAVGANGTVITTSDGSTWTAATSNTTAGLAGVTCTSSVCYAVGAGGAIIASTDGGTNWAAQTSTVTQPLSSIACSNADACFAGGALGTVVTTVDGGATWTQQGDPISGPTSALNSGPTGITAINAAACAATRCVFGTGSAGDIMTTPVLTVTITAGGTAGTAPSLSGLAPSDPSISYSPADEAGNVTGTLSCSTTATGSSPAGSYPVSACGGLSDPGFSVVYDLPDSSYTVGKIVQAISLSPLASSATAGTSASLAATGGSSDQPVLFSVDATTSPADACTVSQSGAGAGTVSFAHAGTCVIDAEQAGDATHLAAATATATVTVAAAASSVSLAGVAPTVYGQSLTVSATVQAAGGATAAGAVQFEVDGAAQGTAVTVGSGGIAASPELGGGALTPGSHQLTASFTPQDPSVYASSTASATLVVNKAATATVVTVHAHTLSATVTAVVPGAGAPTGEVAFSIGGKRVGSASLHAGTATLAYKARGGKRLRVAAAYGGDSDFTGSSASAARRDPTITAKLSSSHAKGRHGWWRSAVTVRFTCRRHTARLTRGCPKPVTLSHQGAGQSLTRTIHAADGGIATVVVNGISIDRTKPRVKVTGVHDGGAYDGHAPVAKCVAADSLSGLASCRLSSTRHRSAAGAAVTIVHYRAVATDRAGNRSVVSGSYRILAG